MSAVTALPAREAWSDENALRAWLTDDVLDAAYQAYEASVDQSEAFAPLTRVTMALEAMRAVLLSALGAASRAASQEKAVDLGPHPDCSCKATGKPCPCRWSLDPKRIALDRAARINAADASDETLKKGLKLIEALLEPCETPNGAVDHAWRQCRRCLAATEFDADNQEHYAPLLRAVLSAAVSAAPVRDVAPPAGRVDA